MQGSHPAPTRNQYDFISFFPAHLEIIQIDLQLCFFHVQTSAGRTTTNEELEEMLEQGNPAVFTQGVRHLAVCSFN
jgi:hypothetical protein